MAGLTVEITYSEAIYGAAKDAGLINEVREELSEIKSVFDENPEFKEYLTNPSVNTEEKKAALDKVFKDNVIDLCYNFLNVLIDKRRIGQYTGIVKEFNELVSLKEGIAEGVIYSVKPLSKERIETFEREAEALYKMKIKLTNELDKSLIGGVSIKVEGKMIDASLKSRLKGLTNELLKE